MIISIHGLRCSVFKLGLSFKCGRRLRLQQAFFCSKRCTASSPVASHSKSLTHNCSRPENKNKAKKPNHQASDTNPTSQDWRPSRKQATTRAINESAGRQASPDKKPIKTVQLYKSKSTLARYQRKVKDQSPQAVKIRAKIGRSVTTDIIRRR